jgi:hypothetical protein
LLLITATLAVGVIIGIGTVLFFVGGWERFGGRLLFDNFDLGVYFHSSRWITEGAGRCHPNIHCSPT